ncbi:epithelial-stromal interaction protein 1 isoform X1 [Labrus bergylta]|uniref:epithelial-stromal interaction protein 1 isoform X1 n=2 Tax=Labrus bergylta TaxID=56723 RepID=UPI0033137CF6
MRDSTTQSSGGPRGLTRTQPGCSMHIIPGNRSVTLNSRMPATKVIKQSRVEASRKTVERTKPVKVKAVNGAQLELRVPSVRKSRASSCPRCPQRDRCEEGSTGVMRTALKLGCERRSRSSSTAHRNNPDCRKAQRSANVNQKCQKMSACQREQRAVRVEAKHAIQSHKAFTVIPPNPKKRREIQRKAEAELAALEELRLSRAMAYVSINPSSVGQTEDRQEMWGGCMSLEEVRSKQQQEMMKAKRKQKPIRTQVLEEKPVLEI